MSQEAVRRYFESTGCSDRIIELTKSGATVELAARVPGCEPEHIAKIDNRKFRDEFNEKACYSG